MSARDLVILGCSSQQQTRFRNHGAYLLRWNDEGLLFDPGEGTQRQFIHAEVPPPCVTRIFISHFHGDHCLGLGSMLLRLNLDKVKQVHCYFPASGQKYFDALHHSCIYHETIEVIEHPVRKEGLVEDDGKFRIEAAFLDHGVQNIGWRITEPDTVKFHKDKLKEFGLDGLIMRDLEKNKSVKVGDRIINLDEVSYVRPGDVFAYVVDTRPCKGALTTAKGAKLLLCEATYLDEERQMAHDHKHMTSIQAAELARDAGAQMLVLTHFSARYRDLEPFGLEARTVFPNTFVADDLKRFAFPR